MRDVELYQQLLGLVAPWTVGRVELSMEGERVDIWAEHAEVRWPCPECGTLLPVYLESIRAIAMDMWPPTISSTLRHVPGARDKIVFDPYHIMSYMNEAVDEVRKREHREYRARGDETLARSRYLWLYAQERLPHKHQERFAALRAMNLKTGRAWAIKESLREFWKKPTREEALAHWKLWYRWATHSRLKPVIKTAKNIQQKLHNVLTYFTHRITNAVAEGLNSKIQTIKKAAYGFRSFENFRTAIFFHCGGLRLYPMTHAKPG